MSRFIRITAALALVLIAGGGTIYAQTSGGGSTINISGVTYTKWLWGNQRYDGSLYNFTNVPGEGWGDNGQGTEIELLVSGKPNRFLEVSGRIHSRFSQNFWTNFGGFGGSDGSCSDPNGGGDCGEYDPRSNQYVKLRGLTVRVTPGFQYLDAVTFGSTDLGMFDAFTMGKIRYIDRDNLGAIMAQGSITPNLRYDAIRVSLPRLWAGPGFNTGEFAADDSAYGVQLRWTGPLVDVTGIAETVNDVEIKSTDFNDDNGRDLTNRYSNDVIGIKADIHPSGPYAFRGAFYHTKSNPNLDVTNERAFGLNGYSPVIADDVSDNAWKLNADINDPFGIGLSFNAEVFNIGADYLSILAARRESDVLLTEGHDATWAYPGPSNGAYGVFGGNPTRIGYSGWQGNMQQVATINVDNEFTDFDEPAAETVIGWKGITIVPRFQRGPLEIAGEYSHIDYNTNWQAWDDPSRGIENTKYPAAEIANIGVGNPYRSAYAPFQEKETDILLVRGKTTINAGKGVDVFGKIKTIQETDKRLDDPRFLPYQAGDCPGGGVACANVVNQYSPGNTTAAIYGNPGLVTVGGVTGYQFAPFDDIGDDDRDLDYMMFQLGAGYQLTDIIYGSLAYEHYSADLQDGNSAFQAYRLHEMASGEHTKNKFILLLRFPIGGAEAGFNYEYAFGEFEPDFGGGFVPQLASAEVARNVGVREGSLGFAGRFGGWNSLETREFDHQHLKAYFKVRF